MLARVETLEAFKSTTMYFYVTAFKMLARVEILVYSSCSNVYRNKQSDTHKILSGIQRLHSDETYWQTTFQFRQDAKGTPTGENLLSLHQLLVRIHRQNVMNAKRPHPLSPLTAPIAAKKKA